MAQLNVVPEQLLAASAQVEALMLRLTLANTLHAGICAGILPPGSDLPSVKTAASLQGHDAAHQVSAAMGNEELARSGMGIGESGISYLTGDSEGAVAFVAASGA